MKPRTKVALSEHKCEPRKKMRRRIRNDVGIPDNASLPHFLTIMASWSIRFPFLSSMNEELQEYIREQLIDSNFQTALENARCLNWCPNTTKLYPLVTRGDGNCLPHATSLFLWGIDDRFLFLRRFIYATLVDESTGPQFRQRWLTEKQLHNSYIPDGGLELQSTEWDTEWQTVVANAEETRNTTDPNRLPYNYLEEIHIFALCNVLRRPIIILAEDVIRNMQGTSICPNNCSGVYLPLLWNATECTKYPVVLGYNEQHFSPLVPSEFDDGKMYVIPLIKGTLDPHVVHFTTENEQRTVNAILQEYLHTSDISYTRRDGHVHILCVKLHKSDTPPDHDVVYDYIQVMERKLRSEHLNLELHQGANLLPPQSFEENIGLNIPSARDTIPSPSLTSKQCDTIGCDFFALPEHGYLCSSCLNKYLEREGAARRSPSDQTSLMRPTVQSHPFEYAQVAVPTAPESIVLQDIQEPMLLQDDLSVLNVTCSFSGCKNHTSYKTYPFCHEHKKRRSLSRASSLNEYFMLTGELPSDIVRAPNRYSSRSLESFCNNTGNPCEEMGCRLYCPPGQRFCPGHQQEHAQQSLYNSITTEVSLIAGQPIAQASTGNKCKVSYCSSEARSSDNLKGYCMACYIKECSCTDELEDPETNGNSDTCVPNEANVPNITNSSLADVNGQLISVGLNDLNSGLSSNGMRASKSPERLTFTREPVKRNHQQCKKPGCNGRPSDGCQGYCQSCYNSTIKSSKQIATGTSTLVREKHNPTCAKPGCNFAQAKNHLGLCNFCYKGKQGQLPFTQSLTTNTERVSVPSRLGGRLPSESSYRRSSWQAPSSSKPRYNSHVSGEWHGEEGQYVRSCKFQGCSNIMEEPQSGLCYRCFNILCENIHTPSIPEGRLHCKRRGCDFYGDALQQGYCSRCFNGYNSKDRLVMQQPSRVAVPPIQPLRGSELAITGERRAHSHPLRSLEQGLLATDPLERIECSARQVTAKCLTTGCPNRGNSKCQGYCNACAGARHLNA